MAQPPESIIVDNGSEFIGHALEAGAMAEGVQPNSIRPVRPITGRKVASTVNGAVPVCAPAQSPRSYATAS
jgi:hypothetical protein